MFSEFTEYDKVIWYSIIVKFTRVQINIVRRLIYNAKEKFWCEYIFKNHIF